MGSRLESNSGAVRKRIEQHRFEDEEGDEYEASTFGGFSDYMRRKKLKLQNLDAEKRLRNTDKPLIFRGAVAYVNGYTQPPLNDLHNMIVAHGGGFLQYLDGKTMATHIIASNLTPKKRDEFRRYRIVRPAWVVESIKAGKLLPWDAYRIIDDGHKQRVLGFQDGTIVSQSSTQSPRGYRDQSDNSWWMSQVKDKAQRLKEQSPGTGAESRTGPLDTQLGAGDEGDACADVSMSSAQVRDVSSLLISGDTSGANDFGQSVPRDSDELTKDIEIVATELIGASTGHPEKSVQDKHSTLEIPLKKNAQGVEDQATPSGMNLLTAEEHNAVLLADPKMWKSTVVNPNFLKQYYEESRLHHLSAWKAELKSQLQALAQEQSSSQKARNKRPKGARRYILHIDFDSFFVAVSLLKNPQYKDKPAVVAHGGGSGSEIASCNYPAREYGVKNGMWMKTAQELCADLKVLPYDFKAYENASREFYNVIMSFGGVVQSVSVDEALLDVSATCIEAGGHDRKGSSESSAYREQEKADEIGNTIREEVKKRTGCAVSVGIGANILQAKLALRQAKPAGQFQLKPDEVLDFIGALSAQDLPGVAYSIGKKLEEIGIKYVKDIRETTKQRLVSTLGPKTGEKLWEYARGIDRVEVGEQAIRKSVSAEVNWGIRFVTQEQAEEFIRNICEELSKRLLNEAVKGKQFTMKVMRRAKDAPLDPPKHLGHGKCDTFNKSIVLGVATNDREVIAKEGLSILRGLGFSPGELRGIGVQMTKLEPMRASVSVLESSQKLLNFSKPAHNSIAPSQSNTSPETISTPRKQLFKTFQDIDENTDAFTPSVPTALTPARIPILNGSDDIDSPHKPRTVPVHSLTTPQTAMKELEDSILNTTGTQFILPTQVDPDVLAELPGDIRSRFSRANEIAHEQQHARSVETGSRPVSPSPAGDFPTHSQLDPEILAALPEDIRKEVLAQYRQRGSPQPSRQVLLPQSPRKNRMLRVPVRKTAASKRGGLSSRGRPATKQTANTTFPTLTQSAFVATKRPRIDDSASASAADVHNEVSAEYIAGLPEDIQAEVLEQQWREWLRETSDVDFIAATNEECSTTLTAVQRRIRLPPRAPRPTFTANKISTLPQLRETVQAWFKDFGDDEPAKEDVDALGGYLRRVVIEEKDMAKAVAVVKWLVWMANEASEEAHGVREEVVARVKESVMIAVRERGLGDISFD